ncbi:MAG: DUF4286 family protein [Cytophagales bacterium]|nr:MAG: DUF4286 family protein [Cytophagales bacterium]
MILYNLTINIEDESHDRWLKWMREIHIPEVMQTGYFTHYKMFKLLTSAQDNTGTNYAIQYFCESMEKFNEYEKKHAPALRADVDKHFQGKYYTFRSILEEIS